MAGAKSPAQMVSNSPRLRKAWMSCAMRTAGAAIPLALVHEGEISTTPPSLRCVAYGEGEPEMAATRSRFGFGLSDEKTSTKSATLMRWLLSVSLDSHSSPEVTARGGGAPPHRWPYSLQRYESI